jgi:hypothetical protein
MNSGKDRKIEGMKEGVLCRVMAGRADKYIHKHL